MTARPAEAFIGPRPAEQVGYDPAHPFLHQVLAGVLVHNVFMPFLLTENASRDADSVDVTLELQFKPLPFDTGNRILNIFTMPRPLIGGAINTSGEESRAFAGLTFTLIDTRRFFFELSLGIGIYDDFIEDLPEDEFGNTIDIGRPAIGGPIQFRNFFDIGFRLTERQSISITYEHNSNAELFEENDGLDNIGVRYGFRF